MKPVDVFRITSIFGYRIHPISKMRQLHAGIDLGSVFGSTVFASRNGAVIFSGISYGYGKTIIIRHTDGYTTLYGHLSKIFISAGKTVVSGTPIGRVGMT